MPVAASFRVLGWSARLAPHGAADWARVAGGAPAAPGLPPMLRRRLTPVGAAILGAAGDAGADGATRYVFCSRHGEITRTLRLLRALATEADISPADFSLSVHNALAGLLSIAHAAHAGHTAIAAGTDSFAAGLIEAVALLRAEPARPVLLVYGDEALPPPLHEVDGGDSDGLALAVRLAAAAGEGDAIRFTAGPEPGVLPQPTVAQAAAFMRFLADGAPRADAPGGRMRLEWCRADA